MTRIRGWQLATIKAARIGYMPQEKRSLLADLNLPDKWRRVIAKFPSGMIVYIHLKRGRLQYLNGFQCAYYSLSIGLPLTVSWPETILYRLDWVYRRSSTERR